MPCLINKLKSHMLFTCKHFLFNGFKWKKLIFAPGNEEFLLPEIFASPPHAPFSLRPCTKP